MIYVILENIHVWNHQPAIYYWDLLVPPWSPEGATSSDKP